MDDELKAIQDDLDSVLDRLSSYLKRDEHVAARVVFQYVTAIDVLGRDRRNLADASAMVDSSDLMEDIMLRHYSEKHGAGSAQLLAAMSALSHWGLNHGVPPRPDLMETLSRSALEFMSKGSQYFGQGEGLPLTPKRQIDWRRAERDRAAEEVWLLNFHDPANNPISEALFERVGERFSMSASVVKRAYYSPEMRRERELWSKPAGDFSKTEEN
jgi:hypothetical protein